MTVSQVNVKPRLHPIGDPDHILQTRAIGVLEGWIAPDGAITLTGAFQDDDIILGEKVPGLVQKLLKKKADTAMFVVWPRTKNGFVNSLEVIGVWKPSVLDPDSGAQDDLPEGENYFSIRGKVRHNVPCDENYGRSVAVQVFGQHFVTVDFVDAPYLSKGDFVSMNAFLTENGRLYAERIEKISISDAAKARPRQHHGHQLVRRRSSAA